MGDTELVEGEAYCSHMDNDQNVDIDDALSYFDERIQDVLGQYQKDFEGGISAQNLGARFGGYGSFLPTYQQSPIIWSHSATPQKGQHNHCHDLSLESAPRNSTLIVRPALASSVLSLPELRNSSVDALPKVWNSGDCVSSHKPLKLPIDQSDRKSLKFRIKVGPDNVLAEKKASIYSNLGLDMSPSSVSEGIPAEWEGVSPDSLGKHGEYPSSIIKIMTSFPIPNGVLLSPLHDSLVCLIEDKNLLDDSRSGPVQKRCPVFKDEVASKIHSKKVLGEKKKKFGDKNRRSLESKNGSYEDPVNPVGAGLKKEGKIMTSTSKEIVSNNLKLPPESNKLRKGSDMADGTGMASEANMGRAKDRFVSLNMAKEEETLAMASRTGDKQTAKNSLAGTNQKDKKVGRDLEKGGGTKGDRSLDLFEEHCDMPKGSKVFDWGTVAPAQQNCERKTTRQHDDVEMSHGKEQSLFGGEKRSKRCQNYDTAATRKSKESLRDSSSSESKDSLTYEGYFPFKSRGDDKLHKGSRKAKDSLSVTTANKKLVEKECVSNALGIPLKDQAKDSKLEVSEKKSLTFRDKPKEGLRKDQAKDSNLQLSGKISCAFSYKSKDASGKDLSKDYKFEASGKGSHAISNKSKETSGKGLAKEYRPEVFEKESYTFGKKLKERSGNRKNDFLSFPEAHLKGHLKNATTLPSPLPTEIAPVVIEENWVCCDKCHKWRLLPYGTNPDHLPKKWLCSMLNWLPGMNNCSFSEEETTNALNALYQVSVPATQHNQQTYPVGTAAGETSVNAQHLNQNCQDLSFTAVPGGGKKKLGANAAQHSGYMDVLNLKKKNQQVPVKSKGLQNMSQSSLELQLEKRSGDAKSLKTKSRRQSDLDGFRPFKKAKTQSAHYTDKDQDPAGLSMKEVETDIQKYNEIRSIYIKGAPHDGSLPSVKQSKKQVHKTIAGEDHDKSSIAGKKRKLKERQDTQIQLDSNRHHAKDEQILMEESSGRECKKEKKVRESKFQGKETSTSKASGEPGNKGKVTRILLSSSKNNPLDGNGLCKGRKSFKNQRLERHGGYNLSEWTVDGNNSSRRDLEVGQPCIAAASSSSMILGSGKIKVNFPEFRGSPAESVCSSPLRISNSENFTRSLSGKDGGADVGLSLMNSPGRCLVGKGDGGRNESGLLMKEKDFPLVQNGSSGSPLFDYQDELTVHKIHERAKSSTGHSSNILNSHLVSDCVESDKQNYHNFNEPSVKHHFHHMERVNDHYFPNKSPEKSRNGSSSLAKKRLSTPISEYDESRIRISKEESDHAQYEFENESHDFAPYKKDIKLGKIKIHGNKSTKVEKNHAVMRVSAGKCSSDSRKRENRIKHDSLENPQWKMDAICLKGEKSVARQNLLQSENDEKSSKWVRSERTRQVQVAIGNGGDCGVFPADGSDGGDSFKDSQHLGKDDYQDGLHHVSSRHPTSKRHGIRDTVSTSHRRKDNSTHAANSALKEAEDLKHSADRLKVSGSGLESTEVCFQAALKFLHGASLLDPCNSKSAKYGDTTSTAAYSTTAKLCEHCAGEYERCKDMASAALAYKCMEVAYMRIIYSNHFIASSDRHELQMTLQMVSPVESPSSSASDVDNLNNQAIMDKMDVAKDGSSLQVTGNHVIAARNRPKFVRLLNFAQDVNFAMEASRKSQIAFAAANVVLASTGNGEAISSIRRVLDFSFHDVEELLQLVRLAMEALCSG